jgi:diaminohydroxyphosphoribosylaminopyrimidine deaminase/5-amino-6-(5-phosphoribosylamino)uracil reductase
VMLKLAVSADEKVALAGRRPTPITGGRARNRVHLMRATNDALLTGIGTVLADDPLLTCRLPGMPSPVRIVLDGTLRLSPASRLVASARQVPLWVVTGEGASPERGQALTTQGVELLHCAMSGGRLDLGAVLKLLAGRGITRLMVEAGPILATAFLRADIVDEAAVFRAPTNIGSDGIDALDGLPLDALTRSPRLKLIGSEAVGADTVETFERS